ncbi:unnamed protein product [Cylicocyclus nassatus]|uniref:Secreted protein n=1 Tax=Cylicocyclus nassatus TaxID=53992 RepID=A0AA36GZZ4_CYLNA|nr:unnamed protein product [Cylicocyclus nassatus]
MMKLASLSVGLVFLSRSMETFALMVFLYIELSNDGGTSPQLCSSYIDAIHRRRSNYHCCSTFNAPLIVLFPLLDFRIKIPATTGAIRERCVPISVICRS